MKKLFITSVMIVGLSISTKANTIEILPLDQNIENQDVISLSDKESLEKESLKSSAVPGFNALVSYCAQVQMDVKETYSPVFGPDRANSIALGAFMGCMGYL